MWNKDSLIKELEKLPDNVIYNADVLRNLYKEKKINYSLETLKKYFHSIYTALEIAGKKFRKQKISKSDIIEDLNKLPKNEIYYGAIIDYYHTKGLICGSDTIKKRFGTVKNAFEIVGLKYKRTQSTKKWTKTEIIKKAKEIYLKNDKFSKSYIDILSSQGKFCSTRYIRKKFGSLENLETEANIKFSRKKCKNEHDAYIWYQNLTNHNLIPQYYLKPYFIDWFDEDENIGFEFDESQHDNPTHKENDEKREKSIMKISNLKGIIRIKEKDFFLSKEQLKIFIFNEIKQINKEVLIKNGIK